MTVITEKNRDWGWLASENEGQYAREQFMLIAGQNLDSGAVLGKITASGKFTALAPAAADGSQNPAAILGPQTDASAADARTAGVVGGPGVSVEANAKLIAWPVGITAPQKAAATAALAALGFKLR